MTYEDFFVKLCNANIPLADIRILFDGYLNFDFNKIAIDGKDHTISDDDTKDVISKLQSGYPVNYLVGYVDVRGLRLNLNPWILIPRTETIEFLYDHIKNNYDFNKKKVLDLCTGSGVIGLSIKSLFKDSFVTLSDYYEPVLEIARNNAIQNHLDVKVIQSDYLDNIDDKFDVIISNPPYIEEGSLDVNAPFEPKTALFGGKDGLDAYRKIFKRLDNSLNQNGLSFFEIESTNTQNVIALASTILKNYQVSVIQDMEGKDRYLKIEKTQS